MSILDQAREAQVRGNLREIGKLIRQAEPGINKGKLLGMLACEIALRHRNERRAMRLLDMSRRELTDEYAALRTTKMQELLIRHACKSADYAESILDKTG